MNMRRKSISLLVAFAGCLLLTSCATQLLWDKTDPHEYVVMKRTPENEARLRERGLDYRVYEEQGMLMVEKGKLRKFHDYLTRFFVTPVAVAHDAAVVATVVGAAAYLHSESDGGGSIVSDDEFKRLEKLMRDINESKAPGSP